MPILKFQNQEGRTIQVDSPDGSIPSEQELDQLFSVSSQSAKPVNPISSENEGRSKLDELNKQQIMNQFNADHPYLNALGNTARGMDVAASNLINGATFNNLGGALKKIGINMPQPREDEPSVSKFAQTTGANILGTAVSPINKILMALGGPANTIGQATRQGAVAGGVGGALYSPEDITDVKQRALQGVGGVVVGGAIGAGAKAIEKSIGFMKERGKVSRELKDLQGEYGAVQKSDIPRKIGEDINYTRKQISESRKIFDNDIQNAAEQGSQDFQDKLPSYFKNNSKVYVGKLDNISEKLAKNGEQITRDEFNNIIDDVIKSSQEDFLASGKPFDEIVALKNKYMPSFETGTIEANSFRGMQQPRWNGSDPLDFKEVVNDIKNVKNSLSSKAKLGYKYTPEDVVAAKLMGRWGDFVSQRVPEFSELNQEYKPIIKAIDRKSVV